MKIEKLNDDKIRIVLNIQDLEENDLDFHSFMSNSEEAQDLFLYVLDLAREKVGFVTDNYKIAIETIYLNNGFFVLNITRFHDEKIYSYPEITIKKSPSESTLWQFDNIDNFLDFLSSINNFFDLNFLSKYKYSLYSSSDKYFLFLNFDNINFDCFDKFFSILSEFANLINSSVSDKFVFENSMCLANNINFKSRNKKILLDFP